jgi:drug/metabolite transporter (DMT)-like permease
MVSSRGVWAALLAATLFGASTPGAKLLVGEIPPVMLAGLLYAGAGVGLAWAIGLRTAASREGARSLHWPAARDLPWLLAAILVGGVIGPVLLMIGLRSTPAAAASLLLNLETVFTALIAWYVFREHYDRRIVIGMGLIVAGGIVLSYEPGSGLAGLSPGALAIACACACWALDNNLTRRISANDAMLIACLKGLVAAAVNLSLALALGHELPALAPLAAAAAVGFFGYGVSLALFVVALRHLGTARSGAYFSSAPFFGVALAVLLLGEGVTGALVVAGALIAGGVWLHLSERHSHEHEHLPMEHVHAHTHDPHHQHEHDFDWDGTEPHTHLHRHGRLRHAHPHFPDLHHRHDH